MCSSSAPWPVLLSLPAASPLFFDFFSLSTVQCLCLVSPLVRAATVRYVLRHATLLVRALLCESLYFDELFIRPLADPRVLLVVRSPTFTCCAWPAGCVTSLHTPLTAHCAWSRFLQSCGLRRRIRRRRAADLMAFHESPAMALHGLAQFCFIVLAFLVTDQLWSALAEGLSPACGFTRAWMRSCLQSSVALVFATTSSSCTSPLLAERLGAGTTIVWLLQHSELFVSSFSSPGLAVVSPALWTQSHVY